MPTKVVAGHFEYQDIDQEIDVVFSEHKTDPNGKLMFKSDNVTPVMHDVVKKKTVKARQRVWIPQQRLELSEKEMEMYNATQERHKRVQARVAKQELEEKRAVMKQECLNKFHEEMIKSDDIKPIQIKHRPVLKSIEEAKTLAELSQIKL